MSHHTVAEPESGLTVRADASVALDVGEGFGALIIYPSDRFRGREIEISPVDEDGDETGHRVHTGVHERATYAGVSRLTAVFGSLAAGDYLIWVDEDTEGPTVSVASGEIAELALS